MGEAIPREWLSNAEQIRNDFRQKTVDRTAELELQKQRYEKRHAELIHGSKAVAEKAKVANIKQDIALKDITSTWHSRGRRGKGHLTTVDNGITASGWSLEGIDISIGGGEPPRYGSSAEGDGSYLVRGIMLTPGGEVLRYDGTRYGNQAIIVGSARQFSEPGGAIDLDKVETLLVKFIADHNELMA